MPIKFTPPEEAKQEPVADPVVMELSRSAERQNVLTERQNTVMAELRDALANSGNKMIKATVHRGNDKLIESLTIVVTPTQ